MIVGTMEWPSTKLRGVFTCPNCGSAQDFRLRVSRPFLTFYFIPVIPIGGLNEYVQCTGCKQAFETSVLASTMMPGEAPQANPATVPFEYDLLAVIALSMVEDGQVTENEIRVARRLFENITQENLSRDQLGNACSEVRVSRMTLLSYLTTAAKRRDHQEKLLMVQAIFGVAGADGQISAGRLNALVECHKVLEIDQSEFQSAVASTGQWLT